MQLVGLDAVKLRWTSQDELYMVGIVFISFKRPFQYHVFESICLDWICITSSNLIMPVQGHCNCGSIRVALPTLPSRSLLCYCDNCRRSGGICSVNFTLPKEDVSIIDPGRFLRTYVDVNVASGHPVNRHFCGRCGSPVYSIRSVDPLHYLVKASLFDRIPPPDEDAFESKKMSWLKNFEG